MSDLTGDDRPLVIGPGAIGCALAGALVEAGRRPRFAGRTVFDRLIVEYPGGRVESSVEVVTDPADLVPACLVVLGTKTNQTPAASSLLRAACRPGTRLVVAQNGVTHIERLRPLVPHDVEIVPAVVFLPATRHRQGQVTVTGASRLDVPDTEAGRWVGRQFEGSYLSVETTSSWVTAAWTKLILNAALGAVGVLTRSSNSAFLSDDEGRALTRGLMAEIVPVGRAEGADLADDLPDRLIRRVQDHADGHLSSITVDRLAGLPTEWRDRNQIVCILARRHGIRTPLNDFATTLLRLGEPGP